MERASFSLKQVVTIGNTVNYLAEKIPVMLKYDWKIIIIFIPSSQFYLGSAQHVDLSLYFSIRRHFEK